MYVHSYLSLRGTVLLTITIIEIDLNDSPSHLFAVTTQQGWTLEGNLLTPKPVTDDKLQQITLQQLQQLTDYFVYLEQ